MALLVNSNNSNFIIDQDTKQNSLTKGMIGEAVNEGNACFTEQDIQKLFDCGDKQIVKTRLKHCKDYLPAAYADTEWLVFALYDTNGKVSEEYTVTTSERKQESKTFINSVGNANKFAELLIGTYEGYVQEGLGVVDNPLCGNSVRHNHKPIELFDLCGSVLFCTDREAKYIKDLRSTDFEELVKAEYGMKFKHIADKQVEN